MDLEFGKDNNLLLNPKEFKIDETAVSGKDGAVYCKRLIEKWTPELESEMLGAFIQLYYDDMYENWGRWQTVISTFLSMDVIRELCRQFL